MTRHLTRAATAFVAWWAVLLAIYLVLISSVTPAEVAVGALLAAGAAALSVVALRAFHPASAVPRLRWSRAVWLPYDMVTETIRVAGFVVRYLTSGGSAEGSFADATVAAGSPAPASALRAYGVLLLSLTPAGYVADDCAGEEPSSEAAVTVRVHRIGAAGRFSGLVGQ